MAGYLAEVFGKVCEDFGAVLVECNPVLGRGDGGR